MKAALAFDQAASSGVLMPLRGLQPNDNPTRAMLRDASVDSWIGPFPPPDLLIWDQAGECCAAFREAVEALNTPDDPMPAEAHFTMG